VAKELPPANEGELVVNSFDGDAEAHQQPEMIDENQAVKLVSAVGEAYPKVTPEITHTFAVNHTRPVQPPKQQVSYSSKNSSQAWKMASQASNKTSATPELRGRKATHEKGKLVADMEKALSGYHSVSSKSETLAKP
jgi:hypothetical protein